MGFRPLVGGQSVSVLVLVRAIFSMMNDILMFEIPPMGEEE